MPSLSPSSSPAQRAREEIQSLVPLDHLAALLAGQRFESADLQDGTLSAQMAAFRYGYDAYPLFQGQRFEQAEVRLQEGWEDLPAAHSLGWAQARTTVQAGWRVIDQVLAGTLPLKGLEQGADPAPSRKFRP